MKKLVSAFLACAMAAGLLAGCGTSNAPAPSGTSGASGAASGNGEETVLRVVDWSDSAAKMREEFHKKFEENHPGVKVEYTCLTVDQFKNTIVTMIKSGDGPDLFPIPTGVTLSTAIQEGWYQPMDDYLDDEFFATFDESVWQEGITMQDGKIYTLPENLPLVNTLMYYNQDVLDQAGITELPTTYSEFLDVCKKVTEAGNGQFYGWIEGGKQINRLDALVRGLAGVAGGKVAAPNKVLTVDGKAPYDCEEMKGAMGLLQQLVADGSMHPDTLNIGAPEAREFFAQGQAAFLSQGMWCIPTWSETHPDMNYGVMSLPVPDGVTPGTYGIQQETLNPWMGIYSQSKNPELAAEYLRCLYSEEYGYEAAKVESGNSVSVIPAMNEKYMTNEVMKQYFDLATENTRYTPVATTRDQKAYDFYVQVKDVSPSLGNIAQGVLSNSITDYAAQLEQLSEASTAEWQRACEAAGVDYGVFEFENWDMAKDYTESDYAALS